MPEITYSTSRMNCICRRLITTWSFRFFFICSEGPRPRCNSLGFWQYNYFTFTIESLSSESARDVKMQEKMITSMVSIGYPLSSAPYIPRNCKPLKSWPKRREINLTQHTRWSHFVLNSAYLLILFSAKETVHLLAMKVHKWRNADGKDPWKLPTICFALKND